MNEKIIAGIVLYNPEVNRLMLEIESIKKQVDAICLFDNGSKNIEAVNNQLSQVNDVQIVILENDTNQGIGYALNKIFEYALDNGYHWVLTLDHDTVCPYNIIEIYRRHLSIKEIGMICPSVIDKNAVNNAWKSSKDSGIEPVERCVQSGAIVNVNAWNRIQRFDEWMFVDFVDFDFCKKMRINGYGIYRCNNVIIDHEFGGKKKTLFNKYYEMLYQKLGWRGFKYLTYKNVFSPARVYYCTRNNIAYIKRYSNYIDKQQEWYLFWKRILKRVLRSEKRLMIIEETVRGALAGMRSNVEIYIPLNMDIERGDKEHGIKN